MDRTSTAGPDSKFVFMFSDSDTRRVPVDDETCDPLVAFAHVRIGHHHKDAGVFRVGNPKFRAI